MSAQQRRGIIKISKEWIEDEGIAQQSFEAGLNTHLVKLSCSLILEMDRRKRRVTMRHPSQ